MIKPFRRSLRVFYILEKTYTYKSFKKLYFSVAARAVPAERSGGLQVRVQRCARQVRSRLVAHAASTVNYIIILLIMPSLIENIWQLITAVILVLIYAGS